MSSVLQGHVNGIVSPQKSTSIKCHCILLEICIKYFLPRHPVKGNSMRLSQGLR